MVKKHPLKTSNSLPAWNPNWKISPRDIPLFMPRCSMYGIFTYIWVIFGVSMLVNIPYMEHMGWWNAPLFNRRMAPWPVGFGRPARHGRRENGARPRPSFAGEKKVGCRGRCWFTHHGHLVRFFLFFLVTWLMNKPINQKSTIEQIRKKHQVTMVDFWLMGFLDGLFLAWFMVTSSLGGFRGV